MEINWRVLVNGFPYFSEALERECYKKQQIIVAKTSEYAMVMIFARHVDGHYLWWSTSTAGWQGDMRLDFMEEISGEDAKELYRGIMDGIMAGETVNGKHVPIQYQLWQLTERGLDRCDRKYRASVALACGDRKTYVALTTDEDDEELIS